MTELQILSHIDQMAAHRRDFNAHWLEVIRPKLIREGNPTNAFVFAAYWRDWLSKHHIQAPK